MKVKLQNVRLSFPALFNPEQFDGKGDFRYRATFLMEPNGVNHKAVIAAAQAVAKETWKEKAASVLKAAADDSKTRLCVDGNTKEYDGYQNMIAVTATRNSTRGKPLVLDRNKAPLSEADGKPYGGCYVNATIELWAQDNKYGKCIRSQLLAVQFSKDGDAFSSGSMGSPDDFEEDVSVSDESEELVAAV